jgi:D-alanyl-lipoteichoic acid acyltransferase DltB (MBOAT superfamily)
MTGSQSKDKTFWLYGLSFYSTTLSYSVFNNNTRWYLPFIASNPIFLATGPIIIWIKQIKHRRIILRIKYYAPFFIIGVFFHQIIATPLTNFFHLKGKSDLLSIILFCAVFEMFIYFNFCGLSMIIYSVIGIFGYSVPSNFSQPFSSRNIIDFWKGWHTSLSNVLRVIFYNPIKQLMGSLIAIFCVFMASALWHGVTLNFFIWGAFHAAMFLITRSLLKLGSDILASIIHIPIILVGRLIFSETEIVNIITNTPFNLDTRQLLTNLSHTNGSTKISLFLGLTMIFIEYTFKDFKHVRKRNYKHLRFRSSITIILIAITVLIQQSGGQNYAAYGQR